MKFLGTRELIRQSRRARTRLRKLRYMREAARFDTPFEDELFPLNVSGFDFEDFRGGHSRISRLPVAS